MFFAFLHTLFFWPSGIVVGNLIASAIWAPVALIHLDRLAKKHHREHVALLHLHHKQVLDKIKEADSNGKE